jgi:hypothetical protein
MNTALAPFAPVSFMPPKIYFAPVRPAAALDLMCCHTHDVAELSAATTPSSKDR